MRPVRREPRIACRIGLFERQEEAVAELTPAVNTTRNPAARAEHARQLLAALEPLLSCGAYSDDDVNCRLCRQFSQLRRQMALLVLKATGGPR